MRFNINNYVRVRLTEHGREALRMRTDDLNRHIRQINPNAKLLPYDTVEEDADGWSTWQLWDLMKRLGGDNMSMAGPQMFETEIEIETKPVA